MVGRQLAGLTLLDKVERAGGTLVARIRRGALVILSPSTGLDGARVMDGLIPREMVGSHNEELIDRGWHATGAGLAREWRTADRAEKLAMLRGADDAISILVRNEYLDREGIGLVYVSRVSSDAGYGQAGCFVALLGGLVGNGIASIAIWALHRDWLMRTGDRLLDVFIGLLIGWILSLFAAMLAGTVAGFGIAALLERSPRTDRFAVLGLQAGTIIAAPVVAAAALWLLASANR